MGRVRFDRRAVTWDEFCESEVEHLDDAIGPDLDVGRLEVTMDDALVVRGLERVGNLTGDGQRLFEGKSTSGNPVRQRLETGPSGLRRRPG